MFVVRFTKWGRPTWPYRMTSIVLTVDSRIYRPTATDAFSASPTPCASSSTACRHRTMPAIAVVTLPYRCDLVHRFWMSMSSVDENPFAGSTHVYGPASGDYFSLLCLMLLIIDWKHLLTMTLTQKSSLLTNYFYFHSASGSITDT